MAKRKPKAEAPELIEEERIIAEDERAWEAAFAATTDEQLEKLEEKVRQMIRREGTKPLHFNEK